MSEYHAKIVWNRSKDEKFTDNQYSRGHRWEFDGGTVVPASKPYFLVNSPALSR